jgi:hypothetical protein
LPSDFKALLARTLAYLGHLDSRLTKSAAAGALISLVTALAISGVPDILGIGGDDPKPMGRIDYERKLIKVSCSEQDFGKHGDAFGAQATKIFENGVTPDELKQLTLVISEFTRAIRPIAADMAKELEGVTPPKQYREDHAELLGRIGTMKQMADDLDRALPPGFSSLSGAQLAADKEALPKIERALNTWNSAVDSVLRTQHSKEFNTAYTCGSAPSKPNALGLTPIVPPRPNLTPLISRTPVR